MVDRKEHLEPYYDIAQMTPPVSPIPPTNPPQVVDFSVALSLINSNISQRNGLSEAPFTPFRVGSPPKPNSRLVSSPVGTQPPSSRPSSVTSPSRSHPTEDSGVIFEGRSARIHSQRTTPVQSRTANLFSPSDELHQTSYKNTPSHGAAQRILSKSTYTTPQSTTVIPAKSSSGQPPSTPAPTPPPFYSAHYSNGREPNQSPVAAQYGSQVQTPTYSNQVQSTAEGATSPKQFLSLYDSVKLAVEGPKAASPVESSQAGGIRILKSPVSRNSNSPQHRTTSSQPQRTSNSSSPSSQYSVGPSGFDASTEPHKSFSGSHPKDPVAREAYKTLHEEDKRIGRKKPVATQPLHVFVDMSNVIIGYYDACKKAAGTPHNAHLDTLPKFGFKAFHVAITRERETKKLVAAGSYSNNSKPDYLKDARANNYQVDVLGRVQTSGNENASNSTHAREQCVDELLHLKMAQSVLDNPPGVMVLATGDAGPAQFSDGFLKAVERALNRGWHVELVSWSDTMSRSWTDSSWRSRWGSRFRVVYLDPFFYYMLDPAFSKKHNLQLPTRCEGQL